MTAIFLLGAGVLAGVLSTTAGLASLVSYPALLAVGLSPVVANMTNTVALTATAVGAAVSSRVELRGQGRRLSRLLALSALGGTAGAALLAFTPAESFELVVPALVALASLLLLVQPRVVRWRGSGVHLRERGPLVSLAIVAVALYGGYFGAAAGVLLLAVLATALTQPLVVTNAVKNVVGGVANGAAAVAFLVLGEVDLLAALPLAGGFLMGGAVGPRLVRRVPEQGLRVVVVGSGLLLAGVLAWRTY